MTNLAWRFCFLLGGACILIGGPQHPGGTTEQMLHNPKWVPSHLWILAGFLALLAGLVLYQRSTPLPERTRRWIRLAAIGTAAMVIEMAVHTAASVDHANLVAGRATPVLTTHLVMAVIAYPFFAAMLIGLMIAGVRDRAFGSPWIVWLGIAGALAHGLSAPLVVALRVQGARFLFALLMLFAFWMIFVAFWPLRIRAEERFAGTA